MCLASGVYIMVYPILTLCIICVTIFLFKILKHNEPNKTKFYLYYTLYFVSIIAVSGTLWPCFLFRPKNVGNARIGAWLLKHVTKIYGLEWHLRNGKVLAEDQGAVIVANHQNSLDLLGMFNIWGVIDKLAATAKKELIYIFPFGLCAYLAGVVFVDRRNPKTAYKQLKITSEVMVNDKTKIWVFPEGTRNKDYTKLLPFKKGAFSIAVAAQVPIIPLVYSPYYFINKQKYIFNKGHIIIQALDPIPTVGLTMENIPDLIEEIREKMTKVYKELSKEVLSAIPEDYPYTMVG